VKKEEETRFVDAQRTHPRQRLDAPEQISIQSNTNAQAFGVQPLFPEAQRYKNIYSFNVQFFFFKNYLL